MEDIHIILLEKLAHLESFKEKKRNWRTKNSWQERALNQEIWADWAVDWPEITEAKKDTGSEGTLTGVAKNVRKTRSLNHTRRIYDVSNYQ